MHNPELPTKQKGVVLLLLLMIMVISGSTLFLASANSSTRGIVENQEIIYQMEQAKAALIAYAINYTSFGDLDGTGYANDEGPGHLPCPDTDNDGEPNIGCAANVHGRMPTFRTLPDGSTYHFGNYNIGIDQQFWYVVSPEYREGSSTSLNTTTTGSLTLDGESGIVAVIIAPGIAHADQDRASDATDAANYLEGSNITGNDFSNSYAFDPANFNDLVLPITDEDIRSAMAIEVSRRLMTWNDTVYDLYTGSYLPASGNTFEDLINYLTDSAEKDMRFLHASEANWESNYTYTKVNQNQATISYSNCNITFTMNHGGNLSLSQPNC